jgi:hypothetical protein
MEIREMGTRSRRNQEIRSLVRRPARPRSLLEQGPMLEKGNAVAPMHFNCLSNRRPKFESRHGVSMYMPKVYRHKKQCNSMFTHKQEFNMPLLCVLSEKYRLYM